MRVRQRNQFVEASYQSTMQWDLLLRNVSYQDQGKDAGGCFKPQNFWSCAPHGFKGCCAANPCDSDKCHDSTVFVSGQDTTIFVTTTQTGADAPKTTDPATGTDNDRTTAGSGSPTTASAPESTAASASPSSNSWPASTTTAVPPPDQGNNTRADLDNSPVLSTPIIVGIGVGGATVILLVLFLIICLVRRRRKRFDCPPSPVLGNTDTGNTNTYDDKYIANSNETNMSNRAGNDDVFAPFGGRANSSETSRPITPMSPQSTGVSAFGGSVHGYDMAQAEQPGGPVQLDSRPVYFELDSAGSERKISELPSPVLAQLADTSRPKQTTTNHTNPSVSGSTIAATGEAKTQAPTEAPKQRERVESINSPPKLTGTLNATDAERANNRHVNSWANL